MQLKPGFHYPSSRPESELGCIFDTRVDGPSRQLGCQTRAVNSVWTPVHFLKKMHPSSRAVNSARELGPWTRVVETGLYASILLIICYAPTGGLRREGTLWNDGRWLSVRPFVRLSVAWLDLTRKRKGKRSKVKLIQRGCSFTLPPMQIGAL